MLIGPIVNSGAIILGGLLGGFLGVKMPERLRTSLPQTFGLCSMALGVVLLVKMHSMPVVILSVILGAAIGELFYLERYIARLGNMARGIASRFAPDTGMDQSVFTEKFVAIIVLFCASGTGIIGAMTEGMTHDPNILFVKAIMDLFTAAIFATVLGYAVALIFIPQWIVQFLIASAAVFILPLTNAQMMGDFTAAGGFIMLAAGFRISGIKSIAVGNLLPALILVMPISHYWSLFIH
ncbi:MULTISPECIES: DUF554 domain-containing protein [Rahnella]|jgi:uncharacterized membrane protein YqgA involved in biofilm formation|uniref:DUF554 domain-containing protein n=1 Tax=Rahnella contaminans TaxID=2703882 RepID=A0A6M2B7H1_9GAMM|nr:MULTISPECIES: DUF554 domain-containing protein [Rahnella]KAB8307641.1 DUF554 domain-containing protein [Rouxiella chamberiensis]MBF7995046.1 DUF554 domain-containing protein [Rahnella laticis]MBU9818529.1 DUF554 domain-containing protein [Rahnella sp. BCC 1045]MCS3424296.1 putative membrane protein YqgA involved in biofilm formation [Rahnella sp. BIGb0603]MDF1895145.1 DUF554 domain-containing protein [Rahnella contaminans]